jgi:hypothetical protein
MVALYPDGVMEDQLTEVAARLRAPSTATPRLVVAS